MSSGRKGRVGPGKIKKGSALGRSLMRDKKKSNKSHRSRMRERKHLHTTDCDGLKSVYETTDLESFLTNAELAGRTFQASRESAVIVGDDGFVGPDLVQLENAAGPMKVKGLQIPKRPTWTKEMTPEELDASERMSFLKWRRELASLTEAAERSESLVVTPFEKNLEVWRQLWRVLERSDIVLQIVDVRNPDLYRSRDLEEYTRTLASGKRYILLLNKADFMPESLRERWASKLCREGVDFLFFSAKASQNALDEAEAARRDGETADKTVDDSSDSVQQNNVRLNTSRVLTRTELVSLLHMLHRTAASKHGRSTSVVGTVGFPNVGKSSLINVLMAVTKNLHTTKRVAVGATPGKTKHFQTLNLDDQITLCDCPGLVFPTFMRGKADMVVNGILPIDQLREYLPPVALVCRRIPRSAFAHAYALDNLRPRPDAPAYTTAKHLLGAYAKQRGYYRAGGSGPDMARSARYVLKDYATGKLLFCFPPDDGRVDASPPAPPGVDPTRAGSEVIVRTAEGGTTVLCTREANVAEANSAFDADLLDSLDLEDRAATVGASSTSGGRVAIPRREFMAVSANPMQRRRAAKRGKGKGAGRRGRHGRDQTPYEDASVLQDFSFVRGGEDASEDGRRGRRRRKGTKSSKNKTQRNGVTMVRPF